VTEVTARLSSDAYRGHVRRFTIGLGVTVGALLAVGLAARPVAAAGDWAWPVVGPVIRGFDPPDSPYGSGHRGIDIAASIGTVVVAPAPGTVTFAGPVGGRLFLTIDHGGGLLSSDSFVSGLLVRKGEVVARGQAVARSGEGHAGEEIPHLHFGVRLGGAYVDPLDYLAPPSVSGYIRLAPLSDAA
jgi:murein DD-endopeptidase MepM/ murein hydrolase activator NlpD